MRKILIVDDEELILRSLQRSLRRVLDVHSCPSGAAAIKLLEQDHDFAVIVSDLIMPGMNGRRFLARARELAPQAVQILLTGTLAFETELTDDDRAGIFRFLAKPCQNALLLEAISDALEERERRLTVPSPSTVS